MKTNELPLSTSLSGSDTALSDLSSGTARVSYNTITEFMKDTFLSGGIPYGKELTEDWATLQARIKAGDFSGIHIGDYKTITLTTGETVIMEVAGIDQYYRGGWIVNAGDTDYEIPHHIDFISRDCLATTHRYNATDTNNGTAEETNPWLASELYQWLNNETDGVITTLPSDLKDRILNKRALLEVRYSEAGAVSASHTWAWKNAGKLWLPTEVEVFGNTFWSDGDQGWTGGGGCNMQYPIFYGGYKHVIKGAGNGGGRCWWWELNARRSSSAYFCSVDDDGNATYAAASYTDGRVPLCFRIA